jgi:hypothetical protein
MRASRKASVADRSHKAARRAIPWFGRPCRRSASWLATPCRRRRSDRADAVRGDTPSAVQVASQPLVRAYRHRLGPCERRYPRPALRPDRSGWMIHIGSCSRPCATGMVRGCRWARSAASWTPPTNAAASRSQATCTPRDSTRSCPRRSPPRPSTKLLHNAHVVFTTRTSAPGTSLRLIEATACRLP